MQNVRVRDVMSRDPATCRSSDTASEAARIMWDRDCGAVPVTDAEGRAIGMVTDRDLCMAAYLRGVRLEELNPTARKATSGSGDNSGLQVDWSVQSSATGKTAPGSSAPSYSAAPPESDFRGRGFRSADP